MSLYDETRDETGIDPDKIAFDGITANSPVQAEKEEYDQDMETAVAEPRTLTAEERCDRCGAQAYLVAQIGDTELLFCAHHSKQHAEKLAEVGTIILDEREKLAPTA